MRVLVIDPGERVGYATAEIEESARDSTGPQLIVQDHGIASLKVFALKLAKVFGEYDIVVYERFVLAAGKAKELAGSDMQTSQLIGIIRFLSWTHPNVQLVAQWPAAMHTAEKTVSREIRAILDTLPKAHDDSHNYSALLHLWAYWWKHYV